MPDDRDEQPVNDRALVRRLRAGDESAFEEFFAAYFPRLFRFACARTGGDEDMAEEAVQAAIIKALRRLHTFRGEAALLTWLCTICRNEVSDLRRRAGRTAEVGLLDDRPGTRAALDMLAALAANDPESRLQRQELSRLVQVALDHLPARYGDALEWKYIDGLSVDEIAARLGIGYKAAESLLSRAREAFREGFTAGLPEET